MASSYSPVSIWQTIKYFITDSSEGEVTSTLRQEVASYLVGEPLVQIGALESEYSYTEISVANGIPDAYAIIDDDQTLSIVALAGRLGDMTMPEVQFSDIKLCIDNLVVKLSNVFGDISTFSADGQEGVGEYVHLVKQAAPRIKKIDAKVVVIGSVKEKVNDLATNLFKKVHVADGRNLPFSIELFDLPTLQAEWDRSAKSGTVDLDLSEFLGHPLRALKAPSDGQGFDTYLAIIPGNALANIYARYKTRILQKNLRNFLQAKGKINKGIQETLLMKPDKFLAYNNGLTITASEAIVNESQQIVTLRDFQIVNGGQTTASLDFFKRLSNIEDSKRQAAISKVFVQAKITVVDTRTDSSFIDDVSKYANSQNKVNLSDFGARDNFQDTLSRLMRNNKELECIWDDGETLYWYYEAFRGSYLTSKFQLSGTKRKIFEKSFPKDQVITKLDLAKCENGWDGYPHFVCRGAEKNFSEWSRRTVPQSRLAPDVDFCKELVAKFLLFKKFEALVKQEGYVAFKSQISAYSYSYHRYLLEIRDREINLETIWVKGHVPDELTDSMVLVIRYVNELLRRVAGDEDPAQWAKKPIAWERFKETTKTNTYPKIFGHLKSSGLLRKLDFNLQVACTKAVEEIEKSRFGLVKNEILQKLGIDSTYWEQIRQTLLRDYEIIQTGFGSATRYKKS
jgi:hypothetical protein